MVQTQAPIGKFILLFYNEGSELFHSASLKEKVENLVDLIKIRTKEKGIEYSSTSLLNEIFDVRIELLQFLAEEPDLLEKFETRIIEEITSKYYLDKRHQKLGLSVADTLEVYLKIFSHLKNLIEDQINDLSSISKNPLLTWNGLKLLQSLQPSRELEYYIRWLESSLNYDYALIVSDFIFSDYLTLNSESINELENFLRKSIVDFGVYSIFSNMWQPSNEDETQLIRNIKIKAAILELESGKGATFSLDNLGKLING